MTELAMDETSLETLKAPPPAPVPPRRRLPLVFAGAAVGAAAVPLGLRFGVDWTGLADPLTTLALVSGGVGAAAVLGVRLAVERLIQRPAMRLAREAALIAHGDSGAGLPRDHYRDLLPVADALNALAERLARMRLDIDRAVAASTVAVEEQKSRLAAILNDLHEGVLVCNLQHQVLLFNQSALNLLHLNGGVGLGRNLLEIVQPEPIRHTLERLALRFRDRRHEKHPCGVTAQFVGGSADGAGLFQGQMGLILTPDPTGEPQMTGYVVTFTDATGELAVLGKRDALLRQAAEGFRTPVANLRAMLETMNDHPDMDPDSRIAFQEVLIDECTGLSEQLENLTQEYRSVITGHWPMSDIHSHNLINLVIHHVGDGAGYRVTLTGLSQWLHGDSYTLVQMIHLLLDCLHASLDVRSFDLSVELSKTWVYLDIAWQGAALPSATLDGWKSRSLPGGLGGLTVDDVLQHHRSDLWSETCRESFARLRIPLPLSQVDPTPVRPPTAARPEFFDFDLLHQPLATSQLGQMPLDRLTYVVFDTETTGLQPSQGDEIISIAGVRIVNRRILTGETFNALVNPGRVIPLESIPFHGITDARVADQPTVETVLPEFNKFVSGAVLVAHNAAFDLKFLKLKEARTGIRFENPVLDTMLLSRLLTGEDGDHTIDGIAARLGIRVVDRHTALGDSLVTAAVFLRMLDMLKERNIRTLDDALRSANILMELHQRGLVF